MSSDFSALSLVPKPLLPASSAGAGKIPQGSFRQRVNAVQQLSSAFLELQPQLSRYANMLPELGIIIIKYVYDISSEVIWSKKALFQQARDYSIVFGQLRSLCFARWTVRFFTRVSRAYVTPGIPPLPPSRPGGKPKPAAILELSSANCRRTLARA